MFFTCMFVFPPDTAFLAYLLSACLNCSKPFWDSSNLFIKNALSKILEEFWHNSLWLSNTLPSWGCQPKMDFISLYWFSRVLRAFTDTPLKHSFSKILTLALPENFNCLPQVQEKKRFCFFLLLVFPFK